MVQTKRIFPILLSGAFLAVILASLAGAAPSGTSQIVLATGEVLVLGGAETGGEISANPLQGSASLFRRSGLPSFGGGGTPSGGLPSLPEQSTPASGGLPSFGGAGTSPAPGGTAVSNPLLPGGQAGGTQNVPFATWKQYSLTQAFGYDRTIMGYVEYPGSWQVNLDIYNRMVEFFDSRGTGTSCTVLPGIIGQFMAAQDLAGQILGVLNQSMPNLQVLQQQFNEDPTASQAGMMVTKGRVIVSGYLQNRPVRGMLMTYALAVPGSLFGAGTAVLCLAPEGQFPQAVQEYFNRMIASYEKSLGIGKFGMASGGTESGLSSALQSALGQ